MKIHMENPGKVKSRHDLVRDMQGRDPKSIAESMVLYYMEGGSVDNILNILEGNEASVGSVRDYADDICLKLEDGGVSLVESNVDVDSQQLEIVLDRPSQEMLQECVNRIGKDVGVSQRGDRVTLTVQYDGEMTSSIGSAPQKMVEGVRRSLRVGNKPISNKLAESIARNAKSMSAHRLAATFGISYADAVAVKGLHESRNSKKEVRWIPCSNCSSVMDLTESKTHRCRSCGNEQMFTERELRRVRRETMGNGNCRYCGEYLKESREILSCPQCGWTRLSEGAETKQLNETTLAAQATAGGEMAMQQKDPYEQAPELIPAGCHCGSTLHREGQGKDAEYVCLGMDEEDGQTSQHRFPVDQIFKPAGGEKEEPKQESANYVLKPKTAKGAAIYKMRSGVNVVVEAKDEYSGLTGCHEEGIGDEKEDAGMITYSQKPGPTAEKDVGKKESLYEFAVMMRDSSIASQKEAVSRLRESGLLKGGVSVWHKTESGWDPLAEGVEPCGQILITAKNENVAQSVTDFLGKEGKKTEMGRMNPMMAGKTKTEKEGEDDEGEGEKKKKSTDPEIVYPSLKDKDGEEEPEAEPERSPEDTYPSLKGGDEEGGEGEEPEPEMEPPADDEEGGEDVYDYEEPSGDEEGGEEPEQEYEEPESDEDEGDEDEKEEGARFPAFAGGEEDQYQGTAKDKQMPSSTYQPGSIGANRAGMPVSNAYSLGKPDPNAPNAGGMTGDDDQLPGPGPGTGVDPWAKAWGSGVKKKESKDDPTFSFSENVATMLKGHLLSEGLDINGINQALTESGMPRVNQQQLNALHHLRGQGATYAEMRQKTGLPEEAVKLIIEGKETPQIPQQ